MPRNTHFLKALLLVLACQHAECADTSQQVTERRTACIQKLKNTCFVKLNVTPIESSKIIGHLDDKSHCRDHYTVQKSYQHYGDVECGYHAYSSDDKTHTIDVSFMVKANMPNNVTISPTLVDTANVNQLYGEGKSHVFEHMRNTLDGIPTENIHDQNPVNEILHMENMDTVVGIHGSAPVALKVEYTRWRLFDLDKMNFKCCYTASVQKKQLVTLASPTQKQYLQNKISLSLNFSVLSLYCNIFNHDNIPNPWCCISMLVNNGLNPVLDAECTGIRPAVVTKDIETFSRFIAYNGKIYECDTCTDDAVIYRPHMVVLNLNNSTDGNHRHVMDYRHKLYLRKWQKPNVTPAHFISGTDILFSNHIEYGISINLNSTLW